MRYLAVPAAGMIAVVFIVFSPWATPASAINLSLSYNDGASNAPVDDPSGDLLMDLANYAAYEWEQTIVGLGYSLPVSIWYEDLDPGTLAMATSHWHGDGRVENVEIRVDPTFTWFYDPTPNGDEEFDMSQVLFRDLTPAAVANEFRGAPPETLEVSYLGADNGSNVDVAGAYDLLSVLRHEMGHPLGFTGIDSAANETADGDFDFDGSLVGGFTTSVRTAEHVTGDAEDRYHSAPGNALMYPSIGTGIRRGISATDAFAVAAAGDWNAANIFLRRIDFLGGNDWQTPGFWEGGQVPNSLDDVFIRTQNTTNAIAMNGDAEAWTLTIADGNSISTGNRTLSVFGQLTMEGAATHIEVESGGRLMIRADTGPGDEFDIVGDGSLTVRTGGELNLSEAGHDVSLTLLTVESGGADVTVPHNLQLHQGTTLGDGVSLSVGNNLEIGQSDRMLSEVTNAVLSVGRDLELYSGSLVLTETEARVYQQLVVGRTDDAGIYLYGSTLAADTSLFLGMQEDGDLVLDSHGGINPRLTTRGAGFANIYVGWYGSGVVNQLAGTVGRESPAYPHPDLHLGYHAGSQSHYVLEAGSVTVDDLNVGVIGDGFFTHNDGTLTVHGEMELGGSGGGYTSNYLINDGTATINTLTHDETAASKFTINGGTVVLAGPTHSADQFNLGEWENSFGEFTLAGNELTVNQLNIGLEGRGLFTISNGGSLIATEAVVGFLSHETYYNTLLVDVGTVEVEGIMTLGEHAESKGKLVLDSGDPGMVVSSDTLLVGNYGTGVVQQFGGLHEVRQLTIAQHGEGEYRLSGGELRADITTVGVDGFAEFRHVAGLHDVEELYINSIYEPTTGGGYLLFSAGTLQANALYVGEYDEGMLLQHGGAASTTGDAMIGYGDSLSGTVQQTGGTSTIGNSLYLGYGTASQGSYSLGGGELSGITQHVQGNVHIGYADSSDATYTLVGKVYHVGTGWTYQGELTVEGTVYVGGFGSGHLLIEPAARLTANGGVLVGALAAGELEISGGWIQGSGTMTIGEQGLVTGSGNISIATLNTGTVELAAWQSLNFSNGYNQSAAGSATIQENATLQIGGGGQLAGTLINRGRLLVSDGTFTLNTPLNGSGAPDGGLSVNGELSVHAPVSASDVNVFAGSMHVLDDITANTMSVEYGSIYQTTGGVETNELNIRQASYALAAPASLIAGQVNAFGSFEHTGGTHSAEAMQIGGEVYGYPLPGHYTISGGRLEAGEVVVGQAGDVDPFPTPDVAGTLAITDPSAEVFVSERLVLSPAAAVEMVPGATIRMTGSPFANHSSDPLALEDLANLRMIFEGGAGVVDTFEVASGAGDGLWENFRLGALVVGGIDEGHVQLVDEIDNGNRELGTECLTVSLLEIMPSSTLELAGLGMFVEGDVQDELLELLDLGRLFDSTLGVNQSLSVYYDSTFNWTSVTIVPEPSGLLLTALGLLAAICIRKHAFEIGFRG